MGIKTYDPKQGTVIFGGLILSGFAEDSMIEVEYDEDHFTKKVGADGEVARAKNANRTGKITLSLLQTSLSNDALSALALRDRISSDAVLPFLYKDLSGNTLVGTAHAWIAKTPNVAFGKEIGEREWVLETGELDVHVGGAV